MLHHYYHHNFTSSQLQILFKLPSSPTVLFSPVHPTLNVCRLMSGMWSKAIAMTDQQGKHSGWPKSQEGTKEEWTIAKQDEHFKCKDCHPSRSLLCSVLILSLISLLLVLIGSQCPGWGRGIRGGILDNRLWIFIPSCLIDILVVLCMLADCRHPSYRYTWYAACTAKFCRMFRNTPGNRTSNRKCRSSNLD